MNPTHESPLLGAYTLGALDHDERRTVEEHLAGCPDCRAELAELEEVRDMAGELPAEALLHGPPDDGDLLLARTLRQVRTEATTKRTRTLAITGVAAAVVIAAVLGTGVLIGRSTRQVAEPLPTTASPTETQDPATRYVSGIDPRTHTRLTAAITPAAGWVRVNASITGIPAGERCRVIVVAKDGTRETAGGWLVSAKGAVEGTNLDGAALVAPDQVASIEVVDTEGKRFVSVSV
ncbi:anti-sigma factor family protein [Actinokineospora enzanensis]|uniref:anti-sigma factor family protein n=1 Tax=Actinokineospora enzanensis TaxID=155975 RepID=UPI00036B245D|nr:zf-HC2 domain-containing protein [Actinokineospora enzanensis]